MTYRSFFYPMRLGLLAAGENFMPIAWWTPISQNPFQFLLAVDKKNYTFHLLKSLGEGALCFLPWQEREWVIRAGYLSGKKKNKAQHLNVPMRPARKLAHTLVPQKALAIYELHVTTLPDAGDHGIFVGNVIHVEGSTQAKKAPILFLGYRNFATIGETWTCMNPYS